MRDVEAPTVKSLLDCSVFDHPDPRVLKAAFWIYNCYFLPWIREHAMFKACSDATMDFTLLKVGYVRLAANPWGDSAVFSGENTNASPTSTIDS